MLLTFICVGPSTEAWAAYQGPHPENSEFIPSTAAIVNPSHPCQVFFLVCRHLELLQAHERQVPAFLEHPFPAACPPQTPLSQSVCSCMLWGRGAMQVSHLSEHSTIIYFLHADL